MHAVTSEVGLMMERQSALSATRIVLPFGRSMLAPARGLLVAVAIGAPLLLCAWLMLWHTTYQDPFTRDGWRCFTLTALAAPWPFAALAYRVGSDERK